MAQYFHNTFTSLLYIYTYIFFFTCKELTPQQFCKYCNDNKMS